MSIESWHERSLQTSYRWWWGTSGAVPDLNYCSPNETKQTKSEIVRWSLALAPRAKLTTVGIGKPKLVTLLAIGERGIWKSM